MTTRGEFFFLFFFNPYHNCMFRISTRNLIKQYHDDVPNNDQSILR